MEANYKSDIISSFIASNGTNTPADDRNLIFINKKYKICYLLSIFIVKNNEINIYYSNKNEISNFG